VALGNNCVMFMFDDIQYKFDGVEIDRNRNVRITSTLKNYVIMSFERRVIARNAGWEPWNPPNGYFNFCVPYNMLLGFCDYYRRIVINACHELIHVVKIIVSLATQKLQIVLFKVQCRMYC